MTSPDRTTDPNVASETSPDRASDPSAASDPALSTLPPPADPRPDMAALRRNYSDAGLSEEDLAPDWLTQFRRWFDDAVVAGITDPNAMVLATADPQGAVAARSVLAKAVDADGVVFYTNYGSAKSHDLDANPYAAVTFPWYGLHRQIHVRGTVAKVDAATTAAYWATRPRGSQIGAWASPQSAVLSDRAALDRLQAEVEQRFGGGADAGDSGAPPVPVPPHWGGWRITPETVEFWQGRTARLHDRLRYRRTDGGWVVERLAP
jgi:pyridoxamine 5'-phosphate oxidase